MNGFSTVTRTVSTLTLVVLLAGCVTSTQATRLQKDLDEVKRQLFQVQQDTAGSRKQVEELAQGLSKPASSPTAQADLNASIQSLLDQVRPIDLSLDGVANVLRGHARVLVPLRVEGSLADEVEQGAEARAEPALVGDEP